MTGATPVEEPSPMFMEEDNFNFAPVVKTSDDTGYNQLSKLKEQFKVDKVSNKQAIDRLMKVKILFILF